MSKDIKITKGLDIKLVGAAEQNTSKAVLSNVYAINLNDFHGLTPKMLLKEGSEVKAGEALFYDKNKKDILFVSPVSGELVEIERGARRRILSLKILADNEQVTVANTILDVEKASKDAVSYTHLT